MKKTCLLLLAILTLWACKKNGPELFTPDDALVKVGGAYITQEDFDRRAKDLDKDFESYIKTPAGRQNFLDMMTMEALLSEEAAKKGITKSEEYKQSLNDLKKQQQHALADFERTTKVKMLIEKLKEQGDISVTEEEIKAYYKKYSYQIYLLQILMEDPEQAGVVTRELKRNQSQGNFSAQAKRYSIDPATKNKGGALLPFIPGEFLPEIEIPAANTPLNQVQGFIKTAHGFHIIMKVKEEQLSYNEAKERIAQILEKQKLDAYLKSLKDKYGVEVINEVK